MKNENKFFLVQRKHESYHETTVKWVSMIKNKYQGRNPRKKQNHKSFQKTRVAIFEKLAEIKNKTPHLSKYICEFLTDQGANSRQVWKSVQLLTYQLQISNGLYFWYRVLPMVTWLFCKKKTLPIH